MKMLHRLRQRVSFDAFIPVRDSDGMVEEEWSAVDGLQDVPAEVLTGPGKEGQPAAQPITSVAARITVRYLAALAIPFGMRIRHGSVTYHVESFCFDATGVKFITLVCSTGEKHV